jgi:hypothetical protein
MIAAALAFVAAQLGSIHVVDDDGGADFTSITAAIAASVPGDVILVEPGSYGAFVLDKRLSLLGRAGAPRPKVSGKSEIVATGGFTVAGLELDDLFVMGVAGRGRIDDCRLTPASWIDEFVLDVTDCAQLEVSRTTAIGPKGTTSPVTVGATALRISSSTVSIVECELVGGQGGGPFPSHGPGANGGHGVLARFGSSVVIAACPLLQGGESGNCYAGLAHCTTDGRAGDAVRLNASIAWLRGGDSDRVVGGTFWQDYGGTPGYAVFAASSTAVVSGVSPSLSYIGLPPIPPTMSAPGGAIVTPSPDEPYLSVLGPDGAGATKSIELVGPAGATAILLASTTASITTVPMLGAPLWIGLPALVALPVQTLGETLPATIPLLLPSAAGIEGVTLELQAVFPGIQDALVPSKAFTSNPAFLIVRP